MSDFTNYRPTGNYSNNIAYPHLVQPKPMCPPGTCQIEERPSQYPDKFGNPKNYLTCVKCGVSGKRVYENNPQLHTFSKPQPQTQQPQIVQPPIHPDLEKRLQNMENLLLQMNDQLSVGLKKN